MKKFIFFVLTCMFIWSACSPVKDASTTVSAAAEKVTKTMNENQPPIIDREILFGNPEIAGAQLSPDGEWMSFMKPLDDVRNIWIKKADEPFDNARPLTASEKRPIPGYFWSHDSKYILYVQDKGGDENFQVYALNPNDEVAAGAKVPEARNITNVEGVRALIYSVPESNPDLMYVGFNDRDAAWHDLYEVTISTGERKLIRQNDDQVTGWIFDLEDQLRMASRTNDEGGTELLTLEANSFKKCYSCSVLEDCNVRAFQKGNEKAYLVTNKGDANLTQLMLLDPATGQTELLESDPNGKVDFGGMQTSDLTDDLIYTSYTDDKRKLYFKDKTWEAEYNWLKKQLPGAEVSLGSSTKDERKLLIYANSDTDPGATYLYDRDKKTLDFQYRPRPKLPIEDLANMKPIRYTSTDGLEIPAYLTLPKGLEAKNLPLVVVPHGGPWARDRWGYNSFHQFLANRGYAVLSVNFRGSTGYGKDFLNAGNGEWGEKMQDDLTNGVKYLVNEGTVDATRVGIMGGSYGGYATLAGLTFTPDVYAAGVSIVGPSNLLTLLESIPPYWESIRKMFHERMGDPNTEEGKAQLMSQSPFFHADKIRKPLLVVQGANDPRVKKAESDQIVVAMRELGLPVEYICADDEGHGFRRPENNMGMLAAAEEFLAKHLGGRYQKDMPDDVAQRLKEITLDINTVTMPETVDESKLASELPVPAADLIAGKSAYKTTIEINGQSIPMDIAQTIEEKDGNWVITQTAKTMMGDMKDVITVKKGTLEPVSREVDQGQVKVNLSHSADKIVGSMSMGDKEQTMEVSIEELVFASDAGLYETLAVLPLEVGYTAVYRTFDMQKQKVKAFELKVVAMETIEVPAGKFEAYKTEIKELSDTPGDTVMWFSAVEGKPGLVKYTGTSAEMGGAKITTELSSK